MKFQNWKKFWLPIDLFGLVLGIGLIVTYLLWGDRIYNNELQNTWANLGSEILGVWLSVRVIGAFLERKQKFTGARFQMLGAQKYFYDVAKDVIRYKYHHSFQDEIHKLQREIMYFDLRLGYRKKFLYDSEQKIMIELGELRKQILDLVVRIDGLGEPEQDAEKHRVEIDELKSNLETLLGNYDHLFEELRQDIWEETHPDSV